MPKIRYKDKKFNANTLEIIQTAESIVTQYQDMGFNLTVRQLYYQFVARSIFENTEKNYKRLGKIISDARRAGMIDWNAIEDRTRYIRKLSSWDNPQDILESARSSYHRDLWVDQPKRIEVWIEKDALVGVIENICNKNDIPFFSCRGYVSDSEMWVAAMRHREHITHRQPVIVLHFGDHDPSGIDMTRDIGNRLEMFARSGSIEVRRIALTMQQIKELKPPPNPAKITDSRYNGYVDKYGKESWELDALEPQYIENLIKEQIDSERNNEQWQNAIDGQETERQQIEDVIERWNELF